MSSEPPSNKEIYLIGNANTQICGNKLPSKRQAMEVLFFNLREVKLNLRQSAALVVKEIEIFWQKAQLPTKQNYHCIAKLEQIYNEWRNLQKHKERPTNAAREQIFISDMDNLFDIAHQDVGKMADQISLQFLEKQRSQGRPGNIHNVESWLEQKEREIKEKEEILVRRIAKSEAEKNVYDQRRVQTAASCIVHRSIHPIIARYFGWWGQITKNDWVDASMHDARCGDHVMEWTSSDETKSSQQPSQDSVGVYSNLSIDDLDAVADSVRDVDGEPYSKRSRGTMEVMNGKLAAVLDRCKISDRNSVHIIVAVAQALHIDPSSLIMNRTSVQKSRERLREAKAINIRKTFKEVDLNAVVLHWDGKMLPSLLERNVVDRLPVVLTSGDTEKLLGVPALENGQGKTQADAIFEVLDDWGLLNSVKAFCCDTTASNLGPFKGCAVLLEQLLERQILYFPCRHHICEVILRSVFDKKMPPTTGPDVAIFKRFKQAWSKFDLAKCKNSTDDDEVSRFLTPDCINRIKSFVEKQLEIVQPRDDYKELLQLTLLFIGCNSSREIKLHPPGALHHARWMSRAIYSLKIYLFRDEFKMTAKERKAIREICIFIVLLYVEQWFSAHLATVAPNSDLQFLKKLHAYKTIDKEASEMALKKLSKHLWYLNPETAALSFFDENLPINVKRNMWSKIISEEETEEEHEICPKRIEIQDTATILDKEMDYFVKPLSLNFFQRFGINKTFLELDPSLWAQNVEFQNGLYIIKKLKIVNDTAERAVCLMEDYNNILTKKEDQKQYLLQVVSEHRKLFPDAKKGTTVKDF